MRRQQCTGRVCREPAFSARHVETSHRLLFNSTASANRGTPFPTCPVSVPCHPTAVPFQGQTPTKVRHEQRAGVALAVIILHLLTRWFFGSPLTMTAGELPALSASLPSPNLGPAAAECTFPVSLGDVGDPATACNHTVIRFG